jgi:oligopeptide transport system ATP-binding protein
MYAGSIVEEASTKDLFREPRHPYTLGLLGSLPRLDRDEEHLQSIAGRPPDLTALPPGCPFAPRCSRVTKRCQSEIPLLETVGAGHRVACWEKDSSPGGASHD